MGGERPSIVSASQEDQHRGEPRAGMSHSAGGAATGRGSKGNKRVATQGKKEYTEFLPGLGNYSSSYVYI